MNGPPPKKTPRLSPEASRKTPDDDTDYVGRVAAPRKIDLQRPEVSVVRLRLVAHSGNLRAFADVRVGPLVLRSLRVIQQPGQRAYVSMPQVSDEEGHYFPLITCDDEALKTRLRETVLLAWQISSARDHCLAVRGDLTR
jgi:DNA-binding cell septation regulator SpoVG